MAGNVAREHDRQTSGSYQPLALVFAAFAAGAAFDRVWPLPWWPTWCASVVAISLWWRFLRRDHLLISSSILLVAVATFAAVRHHTYWYTYPASDVAIWATESGGPVCLDAIVMESPRRWAALPFTPLRAFNVGERSRCTIQALALRDGREWRAVSGQALLTVEGQLHGIRSGDHVRIFGRLNSPRSPQNPGQFDFAKHDRASGRQAQIWTSYPECVSVVRNRSPLAFTHWIDDLRCYSRNLLDSFIQPDQLGLANTLVLGRREQLDLERNEQFLETGAIHVLSISGLHVGMIAAGVFGLLRLGRLPTRTAILVAACVTVGYAILADTGAPVTRAALLIVLSCLAWWLGRAHSMANALSAAALLVACLNPADLFRVGPQLSFLSVAVIFGMRPTIARLGALDDPLQRLIARSRPWPIRAARSVWRRLLQATTLSAVIWFATTPVVLWQFHLLSPIAIVINLLLWIPVATALLSGLAVLATGWLFAPVARLCGACCSWSLAAMNELVDWGSSMPFGHFWLPGPNGWWVFGLYAAIGLTVLFPNLRPARRWGAALLAVWVMCGFVASPMARTFLSTPGSSDDPAEFRCTFLAMGHGLAVVMELPDGQVLIYDAGQLGSPVAAGRNVAGYLWARGITHVDAVVVSHADLDHYNGIPDIAERFSIGVVYVSPMMFEAPATSLSALTAALERHAIPIRILKAPDRLATHPRCRIDVLHPGSSGMLGSDNANSLVLAVEAYGRRILLTGDLESPGVEAVLAEVPYDCDVLLAPHHGSARSNPAGFAQWSRPEHVIVSGGYEVNPNVFAAYQQVGANVLHTAAVGAVTVQVREDRLTVRTFRSSHETH